MFPTELSWGQAALLALPILPNLWSIWHAMHRAFPGEKERYLWVSLCMFLPVLGGFIYLAVGLKRSRPLF